MENNLFISVLVIVPSFFFLYPIQNNLRYPQKQEEGASLSEYYRLTNLARRDIYNNEFCNAAEHYRQAFSIKKYPFFLDSKSFILANMKCENSNNDKATISRVFNAFYGDTTLLFSNIPKKAFSLEDLNLIRSFSEKGYSSYDTTMINSYKALYKSDQDSRQYDGNMRDSIYRKETYAYRDSINIIHFNTFLELYRTYGFPSEEKLGVYFKKYRTWDNVISLLFKHFIVIDDKNTINQIIRILDLALETEDIHPLDYASILEYLYHQSPIERRNYNYLPVTVTEVGLKGCRPFVKYSDSLMQLVNTNRLSIGLDSFHIEQRQVICSLYGRNIQKAKDFISPAYKAVYSAFPEPLLENAAKEAGIDLDWYVIDVEKNLEDCDCDPKIY